jgi:hypothetical protein
MAGFYLKRRMRERFVGCLAIVSVAFVALLAAFPAVSCDEYKAPRQLVAKAGLRQPHRDIHLAALHLFQPSLVFYSQREVERLLSASDAVNNLAMHHPVYLFVPEPIWTAVCEQHPDATRYRTVGKQFDFQKNCDILVVTNQ